MVKNLSIILTFFVLYLPCMSKTDKDCLIVFFSNESYAVFPIKNTPKITFDDGVIQILTERYQIMNVRKYIFENAENVGIEETIENQNLLFSKDGNVITLSPKGKAIKVFTSSGIELPINSNNIRHGIQSVDLSDYAPGVYIISIGNESIKIRKR